MRHRRQGLLAPGLRARVAVRGGDRAPRMAHPGDASCDWMPVESRRGVESETLTLLLARTRRACGHRGDVGVQATITLEDAPAAIQHDIQRHRLLPLGIEARHRAQAVDIADGV